jgi:hypothetical protein
MDKPRKELNPKLSKGDRIMCIQMDGESGVPMGSTGTVSKIERDPFEDEGEIISVNWDNGSNLSLLSVTDNWIKIAQETLTEQSVDSTFDYYINNPEIFENFDWKFLKQFLMKLRESSVENMMSVQPFLYSGREWIDRYFGEDQEDNEAFQEVLEMAETAKDKMIQGVLNYMDSEGMEIELDKVNRLMKKFSVKILELYISFR